MLRVSFFIMNLLGREDIMVCNVVCIQTYPFLCDKAKNINKMIELLEKAVNEKPDTQLVVFPELATTGYECGEKFNELAEVIDDKSETVQAFSKVALKHNIHIVLGMAERDANDPEILYNSQLFISNKGEIIGTYRKIHLFDTEKDWFTAGTEYKVFDTEIGRIGLFICYDASFPEVSRILAIKGAELLVHSTNWNKPDDFDMDMYVSVRALENTVYIACCNRIGKDKSLDFFGHTRILDPTGRIISEIKGEVEGYTYASLDYGRINKLKENGYTMLSERRPELYKSLWE